MVSMQRWTQVRVPLQDADNLQPSLNGIRLPTICPGLQSTPASVTSVKRSTGSVAWAKQELYIVAATINKIACATNMMGSSRRTLKRAYWCYRQHLKKEAGKIRERRRELPYSVFNHRLMRGNEMGQISPHLFHLPHTPLDLMKGEREGDTCNS